MDRRLRNRRCDCARHRRRDSLADVQVQRFPGTAVMSNPLFVPAWAESQLGRAKENEAKRAHEQRELELLRSFYIAWTELHAVPKDKKQAAAETLVLISKTIKAHRG